MVSDAEKIEKSRKAGYSDDQILDFLSKQPGYSERINSSVKAGYNPDEIIEFLEKRKEDTGSLLGTEGKLVGGLVGGTAELAKEEPAQLVKELPTIALSTLTSPAVGIPKFIAGLAEKVLGKPSPPPEQESFLSHITPPEPTKNISEIYSDWVREDLPPNLKEDAEAWANLGEMLMPFLPKLIEKGASFGKTLLPKDGGPPPSAPPPGAPPSFEIPSREKIKAGVQEVGQKASEIGSELKQKVFGPNISKEIPEAMSKERIKNTTSAGMELEKAVAKPYEELTAEENKAYEVSKKANKPIEEIHPGLVDDLRASIEELGKIPDPSAPMKRYILSSKKLLRKLAEIDDSGSVVGYKPISNQTLINQIQEYNQIPQFDFPTDTKTGIFKSLIRKITEAVDRTAAKHPQANASWQKAKEIHSRKSDLFADRDVSKWTKLADKNYSKEFSSSVDIDKIRKLTPVLELTEEGRVILQKLKREIVEKMFEDYFSIGKRFDKKQISQAMSELEPILTKDELKMIEQLFEEAQTPGAKAASLVSKFYRYLKRPSTAVKEIGKIT